MIGALPSAPRRLFWILGSTALLLLTTLFAGCSGSVDSGYSIDLIYPLRKDPLVLGPISTEAPNAPISPGKLEESIRQIPAQFLLDPMKVPEDQREDLRLALVKAFGRPAEPLVAISGRVEDEEAAEFVDGVPEYVKALKLDDPGHLVQGGKLYRRHCMHCHGVAGDGRGPSGPWLSPSPRDFRRGVFKFYSSYSDRHKRPRRDDLRRTLVHGIEGTSMPSFALLSNLELEQLVSYIIHLSLRGEAEFTVLGALLAPSRPGWMYQTEKTMAQRITAFTAFSLSQWAEATTQPSLTPREQAKVTDSGAPGHDSSVRLGYQVFLGAGGCIACHQDFGRQGIYRYDDWGTLVRPNNLTAGIYRGGRRPIDLYYRIRCGIGSNVMPNVAYLTPEQRKNDPKAAGLLEEEVWAVINFLRVLPYPDQMPADIREKVYGKAIPTAEAHRRGAGHE